MGGFVTRTWEKKAESRKSGDESGEKGRGEAIEWAIVVGCEVQCGRS